MKKFLLVGFATSEILSDATVRNTVTGKIQKPSNKGTIKLLATDDVSEAKIEKGKTYPYQIADLIKLADEAGQWIEIAGVPSAAASPLTPEQIAENERKSKLNELRKAANDARTKLINSEVAELLSNKTAYDVAEKAVADFIEANKPVMSAEEKLAEEVYLMVVGEINQYKAAIAAQADALKTATEELGKYRKVTKVGVAGEVPERAPKLNYEIAQQIRQEFSVGRFGNAGTQETSVAIGERHGVSSATVGFIVNYTNYKLKQGDTAFTPLVNDKFPAGAPLFGAVKA